MDKRTPLQRIKHWIVIIPCRSLEVIATQVVFTSTGDLTMTTQIPPCAATAISMRQTTQIPPCAATAISMLQTRRLPYFGGAEAVLFDRGTEFANEEFQRFVRDGFQAVSIFC